jgi:ABC-type lipoprotein export system ATPase subunit
MMEEEENTEYVLLANGIYSLYKGKEGSANVVALRGINIKLKHGEIVSIVGPSGSGKSTLLRTLGGLQEPSAGNVFYNGMNLQKIPEHKRVPFRRKTVGYVFQEGNLIPTVSAFNNIVQTMTFAGTPRMEARKRSKELLTLLGMEDRMHSLPTHLSGGERQRVAIARALANGPLVLLMDEPTGNLDYKNAENVMEMIVKLRDKLRTSCLIVTHSKHIASFTDRSLELRDGRFIGQHGGDLKLESLEESRQVFIAPDGTLTLPPEMKNIIETHGELWDMRVEKDNDGNPKIILEVSNKEEHAGPDHKGICPVCRNAVSTEEFFCNSCGAKLS